MYTLKTYLEKYPERADMPIAIMNNNGDFDFIGDSAVDFVHVVEDDIENGEVGQKILVFSNN